MTLTILRRLALCGTVVAALSLIAACASSGRNAVPSGTAQPDKFLYDKGNEQLQAKKWLTAREYFKRVTETYTQSPVRPDAKLGVGDTYLGENTTESLLLAIAEFQEFLSYYPTHARADYAQYKLGMAHFKQMRSPQRDQTETRDTIREFDAFLVRYPNSELVSEVKGKLREAKDRLGSSEYEVGRFYYRQKWFPGAIDRLTLLLKNDPEFSHRDGVYFYLAETYFKIGRLPEALPYYDRLLNEFEQSEFLREAKRRIEEIKNTPPPAAATATPAT